MTILIVEHESARFTTKRFQANPEIFASILKDWKIPESLIEKMELVIEVRDMMQDGTFGGKNGNRFLIYLAVELFNRNLAELNTTIAHELKHLWYLVMMPTQELEFVNGFWINKRKYRWEEKECRRMEKKNTSTPFITPNRDA